MRRIMAAVAVIGLAVGLTGCASFANKGGTIAMIQNADEALAVKYGIPITAVQKVRSLLGIVDMRTLPDSTRVLPAGYGWTQDILDSSNRVVDVTGYHYSAPRVVQAGSAATVPVTVGSILGGTNGVPDASTAGLEALIQSIAPLLKGSAAGLLPAK